MNDFWTVIEAYWDNCEIEIVNDAGVKIGNRETEEADRCKITHRPDGRVLGECGKFILAIIYDCDNRKATYVLAVKKIVWIHKILIYLSLCARFWEKRYRPLRFALLLLFDEKVFGLISSQSGIDMYNIIPLLTFFDLDILPYAALTISNFIILINLCQNALNYHCSGSDISTRNFHFQYIKNFQKKETFQGWIIFFKFH